MSSDKKISIGDYEHCDSQVYQILKLVMMSHEHSYIQNFLPKLIFRKKIKYSKGRRTLAQIKVLGDVERLISEVDFIIIIDWFFWRENPEKQEALLFHELCHLTTDDSGKLTTVSHDVEEFLAVIKKYGDWNNEVNKFAQAARQFELFDTDAKIKAL